KRANVERDHGVLAGAFSRERGLTVKAPTLRDQTLEQRRRLPVVAEARAVLLDARQHRVEPDRLGVEHWSAGLPRTAEAVGVDDADIARPRGEALLQDPRAFVGERRRDPRDNLPVFDRAARDASFCRLLCCDLVDQRVGGPVAAAGSVVLVPTAAGLLAIASH